MKEFVKLNDERIRRTTIKKYLPFGTDQVNVYFNTSKQNVDVQTFKFENEKSRDSVVENLDVYFGII
jgi:hypothetical protein